MMLAALDNVLCGDAMRRRFHSHPLMASAELLLQERVPRNVPVHDAGGPNAVWVRTSVLRLKSKPESKLDGFVSPMNSGSNVVETVLNRDWILLGGNAKFMLAM